jgi:diacylglycerol O-acyltransferase / wax synthase
MIEIRGADAYFLWEESRARHMHTLKIVVVDPSTAHEKLSFERVGRGALRVVPHLAAFRRRPVAIPFGLGHPLWVDAPAVDPGYHLRHEVLPPGAGEEGLDELAGRIASEPLDPTRPLWQLFFVEGLPGGRVAYVTKLHHAVADGGAAAEIALRSFQEDREPWTLPPPYAGGNEVVPPAPGRLARSLWRELRRQRELPGIFGRAARDLGVGWRWRAAGRPLPPRPFAAPLTRFNRPLTPNRVYARLTLPLPVLREVKRAFGCSINDVYLATVGGALRRYLERHGELPPEALTAAVPVSVRGSGDEPDFGNAIAYWFASTGSDVADPAERVAAVTQSTRAARALFEARDPRLQADWLDHWPLRRAYIDGFQALVGALLRRPSYNVIVSNVRGPTRPLYSDGARVEALYSMGPLTLHQGLNFTAWSYLDAFAVGVHACREHVPDLHVLAAALPEALEELRRAAATRSSAGTA